MIFFLFFFAGEKSLSRSLDVSVYETFVLYETSDTEKSPCDIILILDCERQKAVERKLFSSKYVVTRTTRREKREKNVNNVSVSFIAAPALVRARSLFVRSSVCNNNRISILSTMVLQRVYILCFY